MQVIKSGSHFLALDDRAKSRRAREEFLAANPCEIECECGCVFLIDDYRNDVIRNLCIRVTIHEVDYSEGGKFLAFKAMCPECRRPHIMQASRNEPLTIRSAMHCA